MTTRPPTLQRRESVSVHPFPNPSMVSIVLGAQWGDEVNKKKQELIENSFLNECLLLG